MEGMNRRSYKNKVTDSVFQERIILKKEEQTYGVPGKKRDSPEEAVNDHGVILKDIDVAKRDRIGRDSGRETDPRAVEFNEIKQKTIPFKKDYSLGVSEKSIRASAGTSRALLQRKRISAEGWSLLPFSMSDM